MKISLNWLKKYVDVNVSDEELIRLIGARLVEVEDVIDETSKYDNIYIVKVVECEAIPDTHLHLCKINSGKEEIQVVCGAPNVHAGMLAAWIAPGAIVPQSVHEDAPFIIGTRKMLGKYESHGMLAGADELDFGDDHSGIVEIDPELAKPGDKLADVFDLNDLILDIENKSLTHRPDCFGMIGFAREVAGILGQKFNETHAHFDYSENVKNEIKLDIKIEDANLCPRYSARVMEIHGDLKKSKYLTYQDTLLAKSGMRPVDPIVDATNYLMLRNGQPLHAFDYDKFIAAGKSKTPKIIIRAAKDGEKLTLLDNTEIELNKNDIVITSNNIPVALAGAMGGKDTAIDVNTKRIILESATFSLYNLRKTQMAHGIFSEAITRFTKGQPASQVAENSQDFAAQFPGVLKTVSIIDEYPVVAKPNVVKITTHEINALLGTSYSEEEIITTLENVSFTVEKDAFQSLTITAPSYRTDIAIKEDIIEEVGRLKGYDNITPTLPNHPTATRNPRFELKKQIRNLLSQKGANELLTYTFVSEKLLEKAGQNPQNSYKIVNSISPELQYVRQSLIPSLLDKAYMNIKIPKDRFVIFEMNKVYQKSYGLNDEKVPNEHNKLAIIVADRKRKDPAYYSAKFYIESLLQELGLTPTFKPLTSKDSNNKMLEPKRSAEINLKNHPEVCFGVVGELDQKILNNFKLPEFVAVVEIDLDIVLDTMGKYSNKNIRASIFDKVERDLTIETTKSYAEIINMVEQKLNKRQLIYRITPLSIYQSDPTAAKKISIHVEFINQDKSLTPDLLNQIMQELEKI